MKPLPNIAAWRETKDDPAYRVWVEGFKPRVQESIQQWQGLAGYDAGLLLRSLRNKAELWWYFLDHPEVPQDFNQAERSLRKARDQAQGEWRVSLSNSGKPKRQTY